MSDKITTLHLKNDPSTNIYPNVKIENIPLDATITRDGENLAKTKTIYDFAHLNFLSLDGGTMDGIITINDIGIPEKTILGDGVEVVGVSNPANPATHYGSGYIRQDDDEDTSVKYEYNFPKKSGTFALEEELEELKSLVYSLHSLTYNSYEFPYLTSSVIPDEVDGRKVIGGSYAIMDWVGGNSVSFNQLIPSQTTSTISGGITFTASIDGRKLALSGTSSGYWTYAKKFNVDVPVGHKVLVSIKVKNPNNVFMGYRLRNDSTEVDYYGNDYQQVRTTTKMVNQIQFYGNPNIDYGGVEIEDVQLFDLTLMGLDNITSVDEFKVLFPLDYYPYNAGEIKSTIVSKIEVYSTEVVKLGQINIPNAPLKLDGANDIHNTLTFEKQSDGSYNAILKGKIDVVDLGTLDWVYESSSATFHCEMNTMLSQGQIICSKYLAVRKYPSQMGDKEISTMRFYTQQNIVVKDTDYTDAVSFKTAMSGVYLLYPLATPTSEVIATGLTLEQVSFPIEKGGTIKAIYEEVPPTISVNFMTKGE